MAALALLLVGALGGAAAAQEEGEGWGPGTYMGQAVRTVFSGIGNMTDGSELGLAAGVSLFATFLPPGETVALDTGLEEGKSYSIIGGGDEDCADLDISIFDPDGNLVGSDTLEDAMPIVSFTAEASGMYTIKMELFEAELPSFCAMAILAENAWTFPTECLEQAFTKFLGICENIDGGEGSLSFHDEANQWCLYGGVIESGESSTMSTITLEDGNHVFAAAGDDDMRDLDLYLLDGNGESLAYDNLDDDYPVVTYEGARGSDYQVQATNVDSAAPSFVIFAILDQHLGGDQGAEG